ncbi:hypothetical protein L593_06185 [Salinarchaeum sp. Harcht-Bsk1]|uniref:hypothetical protein n=1 Tax=Salinarchaeum sp. Harcht-Bsk1 TaxID=1333523 RepID=UPI0003423B17|nr:hypothetical protein [Salinarchaeum sp. Harcht-Bsk1]AGN01186.1 hypothetical protein L593_06185 [Salinarchaeum sp. Harcht-Bsk1]
MTSSTPFDDYLAAGESSELVGSGTLFQEPAWTPASICVTDRRILFVPTDGGFVDVPRGQVLSIRSRPRSRRTRAEIASLGLLATGVALAGLAGAAVLAGAGTLLVPVLALLGTIGTLATAALVTRGGGLSESDATGALDRIDEVLQRGDEALERFDVPPAFSLDGEQRERLTGFVDERPVLQWAAAGLGTIGAGGLAALGAWTALLLAAGVTIGVGAGAVGLDRHRDLQRGDRARRRERVVGLQLLDGRTVRFRIDAEATIDRELSRLTARPAASRLPSADVVHAEDRSAEQSASTGP